MGDKVLKYLGSKFRCNYDSLISEMNHLKRNKRDAETYLNELLKLIEIRKEIDPLTNYIVMDRQEYIPDFFKYIRRFSELLIRLQDLNKQIN